MRTHLIFAALAGVALAAAASPVLAAVSLTVDQVKSACGGHYAEISFFSGCSIACAGGKTCTFECTGDKCTGKIDALALPPRPPLGLATGSMSSGGGGKSAPAGVP